MSESIAAPSRRKDRRCCSGLIEGDRLETLSIFEIRPADAALTRRNPSNRLADPHHAVSRSAHALQQQSNLFQQHQSLGQALAELLRHDCGDLKRLPIRLHVPHHLRADPFIGRAQPVDEHGRGRPFELLANQMIVRFAASNTRRTIDMALPNRFARDAGHDDQPAG